MTWNEQMEEFHMAVRELGETLLKALMEDWRRSLLYFLVILLIAEIVVAVTGIGA